jgi:hypothetical protein
MIRGTAMMKMICAAVCTTMLVISGPLAASAQGTVAVAVPARAGAVDGTRENSDAFIWRLFTGFAAPASRSQASPVVFETWASDNDTFSNTPHWPAPDEPRKLHASVLDALKAQLAAPSTSTSNAELRAVSIDVPCKVPVNAAVGGFPASGSPTPCIAEETKRNRAQFDYIVKNKLNNRAGLADAFKRSFKVDMPTDAIAVKGNWVPVETLLQWIPQIGNRGNLEKLYHRTTVDSVEYALVSLHVASRQNENWVWGTFEHQLTPGRCDGIGCFDTFGAQIPAVLPNWNVANTQYGACPKTQPLKDLMSTANLAPLWENYCLKSTQVDYRAPDGTPYVLGNSVIEGIVGNGTVSASSCITCHAYASFGANGQPTPAAKVMLPFNPTGKPIPGVLAGSLDFSFMWGVTLAP